VKKVNTKIHEWIYFEKKKKSQTKRSE
jgi:hypothetical protein